MKVEGPGAGAAADRTRRSRRGDAAQPGHFARTLDAMIGADDAAAPVAGVGAATGVEALLAAQTVDDDSREGRRRQACARGGRQLDARTGIQQRLLLGGLSGDELDALARATAGPRPGVDDPGLCQVLDEIDVRVQVELAKRRAGR